MDLRFQTEKRYFGIKPFFNQPQPFFGLNNIQLQYFDTDSLVKCFDTDKLVTDLKKNKRQLDLFDFSKIIGNPDLYKSTNEKVTGNYKTGTPNKIDFGELFALEEKTFCLKLIDEKETEKLRNSTKAAVRNVIFNAYFSCLDDVL